MGTARHRHQNTRRLAAARIAKEQPVLSPTAH